MKNIATIGSDDKRLHLIWLPIEDIFSVITEHRLVGFVTGFCGQT